MQLALTLINRQIENNFIPQRASDGYINATAMCKAVGKQFNDYWRIGRDPSSKRVIQPKRVYPFRDLLSHSKAEDPSFKELGVHPDVAMNLGQWCSPKFAVAVARWVREWMSGNFTTKLPYHLERYMANRAAIPITSWSMLSDIMFNLIAPLEQEGYHLPEELVLNIPKVKCSASGYGMKRRSTLISYPPIATSTRMVELWTQNFTLSQFWTILDSISSTRGFLKKPWRISRRKTPKYSRIYPK